VVSGATVEVTVVVEGALLDVELGVVLVLDSPPLSPPPQAAVSVLSASTPAIPTTAGSRRVFRGWGITGLSVAGLRRQRRSTHLQPASSNAIDATSLGN
jgi:hypothetical protein